MEENQIFDERYQLIRLLGRGNFSEVWLAKDSKTHIEVALKVYAPATGLDNAGLDVFAREFSLVVNANHKNLLKPLYYDTYERKPYLVLPFCKRGSILSQIGTFDEAQAWKLLHDVGAGLDCLHKLNPPIIHQDIKPDNVMVADDGTFMITDFGVSSHVRASLRKSMSLAFASAGTIAYMAPERFGKDNSPVMASDIYSLGATVYEMLDGDTPFGDDGGLMHKRGAEIPNIKASVSDHLRQTIERCLSLNPWDRPTAEQLEKIAAEAIAQLNARPPQPEPAPRQSRKTVLTVLQETPEEQNNRSNQSNQSNQNTQNIQSNPSSPKFPESPAIPENPETPGTPDSPETPEAPALKPQKMEAPAPPQKENPAPAQKESSTPTQKESPAPPQKESPAPAQKKQPETKKPRKLSPLMLAGIVAAFAVVGVVAGLLLFGGGKSEPEVITPEAVGTTENPTAQPVPGDSQTAVLTARADSLVSVGDQHGEAYEDAYIDAYKALRQAIAASPTDELTHKLDDLKKKLNTRYDELKAKADQLAQMGAAEAATAKRSKAEAIKTLLSEQ